MIAIIIFGFLMIFCVVMFIFSIVEVEGIDRDTNFESVMFTLMLVFGACIVYNIVNYTMKEYYIKASVTQIIKHNNTCTVYIEGLDLVTKKEIKWCNAKNIYLHIEEELNGDIEKEIVTKDNIDVKKIKE